MGHSFYPCSPIRDINILRRVVGVLKAHRTQSAKISCLFFFAAAAVWSQSRAVQMLNGTETKLIET